MMNDVMTRIAEIGIVPVIRIDDVAKAPQLAQALCSGGVPVAEITFRACLLYTSLLRMYPVKAVFTADSTKITCQRTRKFGSLTPFFFCTFLKKRVK